MDDHLVSMNRGLASVVLFLFLVIVRAQAVDIDTFGVHFRTIGLDDGLSQSTVGAIAQGPEGFLWVGTQSGLNRFDGYGFAIYRSGDSGLEGDHITALLTTSDGRLFVGTRRAGLHLYDENLRTFRQIDLDESESSPPAEHITVIAEGSLGRLWVGTAGNGLFLLGDSSTVVQHYSYVPMDVSGLPSAAISAVVELEGGEVWIGTPERGIVLLDRENDRFRLYQSRIGDDSSLPSNRISALAVDRRQQVWIGTYDSGPALVRDVDSSPIFVTPSNWPLEMTASQVTDIYVARDESVWITTDGDGVVVYPDGLSTPLHHTASATGSSALGSNRALSVLEDESGLIWIGLFGAGISMHSPMATRFENPSCSSDSTTPIGLVWAFTEVGDGSIWIGTDESGILRLDGDQYRCDPMPITVPGLEPAQTRRVYALDTDRNGRVWIGYAEGGIVAVDLRGQVVARFAAGQNGTGFISNRILSLKAASDGLLWVGTNGSGVAVVDPVDNTFRTFVSNSTETGYPGGTVVHEIAESDDNHIWIGTNAGDLYEYDPDAGRFHYHELADRTQGEAPPVVWSIIPDDDGTLWLGTVSSGIIHYDPTSGVVDRFAELGGSRRVYSALPVGGSMVWASTDDGLFKIDLSSGVTHRFTANDGLQSDEFSFNAALAGSDGLFYFGGVRGFTRFDPQRVTASSYSPPVVYTAAGDPSSGEDLVVEFQPSTDTSDRTKVVVLRPPTRQIALTVAALDFSDTSELHYQYMLAGRDDQWIDAGTRRQFLYTNLRPGEHELTVRGTNGDGVWSSRQLSLLIVVEPSIWERRSFQAGAVSLAFLAIVVIAMLIITREKRRLSLARETGRAEQSSCDRARARAQERRRSIVTAAMRSHQVRLRSQSVVDMHAYLDHLISRLTTEVRHRSAIRTAVEHIHLESSVAIACGLIVDELLTNAVEHAFSPQMSDRSIILIALCRHDGRYVLTVADNGSGLQEPEAPDAGVFAGFNLLNTLATQIGGTLRVRTGSRSWFGRGTEVSLTL